MARELLMPKLGLTMMEGTITKWFVKEGDAVKVGDSLFEVETDKLTNQINADTAGIVRSILIDEGQTVPVKTLIGLIADENEDISDLLKVKSKKTDISTTDRPVDINVDQERLQCDTLPNSNSNYILATPYAKKIIKEKNMNLGGIKASGYNGVIVAKDVDSIITKETTMRITPLAKKMADEYGINLSEINKDTKINKDDIQKLYDRKISVAKSVNSEETEMEKASGIRKIIAHRMKTNWTNTPMVTFNMETDMTELIIVREKLRSNYMEEGIKLTYNHLIIKIISKLLLKYKYLNASFEDETIIYHNYVNIGVAVDVQNGLLVPNLKNSDKMTLREIAKETEQLIEDARQNKLNPDNLAGGTFTITNIGMFGVDSFTPIINKPEVAILGINRIVDKPVVVDKRILIRPMMNLSLTTDHSLVDGALSVKFLSEIKHMIENPYMLID